MKDKKMKSAMIIIAVLIVCTLVIYVALKLSKKKQMLTQANNEAMQRAAMIEDERLNSASDLGALTAGLA